MISPDDFPQDEAEDAQSPGRADSRPSRTEQTRAANAVNRLGLQLTRLSLRDLDRLELPERLREAIELSQRLKPKSRGRQNRLIGQLLRAEDHEAIEQRLESLKSGQRDGVRHEQVTERWLNRLVEEGDAAVEGLIADHPQADRQRLRMLTRNAQQDPTTNKAKRARRELLRAIRALRA
jgi:ribosome-associated protein